MSIVLIKHPKVNGNQLGYAVIDTDDFPNNDYELYEVEPAEASAQTGAVAPQAPAASADPVTQETPSTVNPAPGATDAQVEPIQNT
jgi:hypothetical protein